jgi:hypothetical protein
MLIDLLVARHSGVRVRMKQSQGFSAEKEDMEIPDQVPPTTANLVASGNLPQVNH